MEALSAFRLHKSATGWILIEEKTWGEIQGSSDFLLSIALPETDIYCLVEQPGKSHFSLDHVQKAWLSIKGSTVQVAPVLPWQLELIKQLKEHSKPVQAVIATDPTRAPQSTRMSLTGSFEAQALSNTLQKPERSNSNLALWLGLRLIQKDMSLHFVVLGICLAICLAIWHLVPTWLNQHALNTHRNWIKEQKELNLTKPTPDWLSTHQKLQKFGTENRANLVSITLTWNDSGEVLPWVELKKPRKRLPTGCNYQKDLHVECPVILPSSKANPQ